jgi:hypothetical protein
MGQIIEAAIFEQLPTILQFLQPQPQCDTTSILCDSEVFVRLFLRLKN